MLQRFRRVLSVLSLALAVVAVMSGPLQAGTLDDLLASGAIGERFDGYLAARDASAKSFVNQTNAKRRKVYQQRATAQGVPADQVGRVYAKKIMADAPHGTWLQRPNGSWVRK